MGFERGAEKSAGAHLHHQSDGTRYDFSCQPFKARHTT